MALWAGYGRTHIDSRRGCLMIQYLETCSRRLTQIFAILIVLFFSVSLPAEAQLTDPFPPEAWHQIYESGYGRDVGQGVAIDSQNNVIAAGYRSSSTSSEGINSYTIKYDRLGNFVCDREEEGPPPTSEASDGFYGVAVDSQDNIVLAGNISGRWDSPEGYWIGAYLNRYSQSCQPLWATPVIYHETAFGDSAWQSFYSVTLDPYDNILTTGPAFGSWGPIQHQWGIWKYDSSKVLEPGFPIYYNYSPYFYYGDYSFDIALDSQGNIIAVGYRGVSGCNYQSDPGCIYNDVNWHVRKYSPLGAFLWEDTYTNGSVTNLYNYAYRVAVDSHDNVIVVGYTNKGTDNTTNANYDWLIIKYAPEGIGSVGQRLWTKTYESAPGRSEAAQALAIDADDNIVVGGYLRDASGNLTGRLALLNKDTGDDIGERIITDPANVVPMRLAYRNGALAIGGYIYDSVGNHNMYTAFLQNPSGPIQPTSPTNGTAFDTCSYFEPPTFEWTLNESFGKLELQFFIPANPTKPTKLKLKDPSATQLAIPANTWKKILKLPGLSGGEVSWKIVGTNKGEPVVESEAFTMTISAPQAVELPAISPTSRTGELPTLSWGNACATKFKVYFSPDPTFSRKKKLSFTDKDPLDNSETFSTTLTEGTWNAIRKVVGDVAESPIYWYVESWDVIKRYQKTDGLQFTLEP